MKRAVLALAIALGSCVLGAAGQEWTVTGGDPGGQRYSTLTQITPANVAHLKQAWTFDTGSSNLQITPLVIGGAMYITAGSTVAALEPETGREIWRHAGMAPASRRGLAFWPGDSQTPARLFTGVGDRMVALDLKSGRPVPTFGTGGFVDLKEGAVGDVPGRIGRRIPAVAVIGKVPLLFIFNRETGEPLYGYEERPVPQSTVPGEATSATQPFPAKPGPLGRIDFDPARDMYALTPEHTAYCRDLWDRNQMYTKGVYTPPSVDATMVGTKIVAFTLRRP